MWAYSTLKSRLEFLKVTYRLNNTIFSESYYLKAGELIFAAESENAYYNDKFPSDILNSWSGRYYFSRRKLIDASTFGHGKSEADDWNPKKETLARLTARLKQLRRKLKSER